MTNQQAVLIGELCLILFIAGLAAGCTGSPAVNTGITPHASTLTPAAEVTPGLSGTRALPQTTATTVMAVSVPAVPQAPVSLTVNSAVKRANMYSLTPNAGRIFLILDITVQNNAVRTGFNLTDTSLTLAYARTGSSTEPSITSKVRDGLDTPLIMPTTIGLNDKRSGQVVFGVADGPGSYVIRLLGSDGAVITSAKVSA